MTDLWHLGQEGTMSMKWRPRPSTGAAESWPAAYTYAPSSDERSAELAEVLARLEAATRLRDAAAAARLLDRLAETDDGRWLLHQCAAAGLREVATRISDGAPPHPAPHATTHAPTPPIPGVRSIGAA
jgi:hypothetical protein